ncbi:hypothetical protein [Variovorax sp. RO1]|uniref:hypothetical protein n=1 Tax=Variovorax sp. RO1 TaxID=2066034 RepID=UPI00117D7157|nr:hypothetical protein [Variovorax sp. RO1]
MSGKEFCASDSSNYPKWNTWDVFKWKALSEKFGGGRVYLEAYKDGWIAYNKYEITEIAAQHRIPAVLLASVAWAEVGGKPDGFKKPVFIGRSLQRQLAGRPTLFGKPPERTSFGAVSMQLEVAARELGLSVETIPHSDRMNLISCLETDKFNLRLVAQHLRNLILHDNPGNDTLSLSTEQFIVVGARYNRGIERPLTDITNSIKLSPGAQGRNFSEYGRRMLEHRAHVAALLNRT